MRALLFSGSILVWHKEEIVIFYLGFVVLVVSSLIVLWIVILSKSKGMETAG